ncbi:hypothetical protein EV426DRAFT_433555 [Tirmania nivea]|nr:hypothetical protein EV426DRAFT_433555 [Tirmania nivea]
MPPPRPVAVMLARRNKMHRFGHHHHHHHHRGPSPPLLPPYHSLGINTNNIPCISTIVWQSGDLFFDLYIYNVSSIAIEPRLLEEPRVDPNHCDLREALATVKLYVQQQWDPGMLSLAFEVVDETAIAVQQDLHNLEHHLATLQLRKPQRQTPITSYFQGSGECRSSGLGERK